ncbi:hypothetical protein GCM10027071_15960 [Microbacterium marinum]
MRRVLAPVAAGVLGCEHRGPAGLAGGQQARSEDGALQQQDSRRGRGRAAQQLSGDEGPFRIGVAPGRVDACQAGRGARCDEGAHLHTLSGEFQHKMRHVVGDQASRPPRVGEVVGDEQHGKALACLRRCPALYLDRFDPGGRETGHERRLVVAGEVDGELDTHRRRAGGSGGEGVVDAVEEGCRLVVARAELSRERCEARVGDAGHELVQETFLPGVHALQRSRVVGAELDGGRRSPEGRVRGGETEHAAILIPRPAAWSWLSTARTSRGG